MPDGVLTERIRSSFDSRRAPDAISSIKQAVAEFFKNTDPAVSVERTDYFNHSFAPDLVLKWPREQASRYVYLRTSGDPRWLLEDMTHIGDREPVVMTLTNSHSQIPFEEVSTSAQLNNTMVTEPGVLESLSSARRSTAAAGLLGSALLQGGRGVVGETRAAVAVETTANGFDAAESLAKVPTQEAATLLSELLNSKQSSRLTRLLLAIWEGHGGSPSAFPASFDLTARLSGSDLRYLLESVDIDDERFWRRIGRGVSLEMITQIPSDNMPPTFQYLITANVATLAAKAVRVEPSGIQLTDQGDVFEWALAGRNLALRGNNFTAHLAASTVESLPSASHKDGLSISMLESRARLQGLKISAIRLKNPSSNVTYESTQHINAITDRGFVDLSATLGPETRVAEATISLSVDRGLSCDFIDCTAKGHTSAIYPIGLLLGISVPLMFSLDQQTQDQLAAWAAQTPDGGTQLLLFSEASEPFIEATTDPDTTS